MAESEYEIRVNRPFNLEDMVLFPISSRESHGMEDMRLVRFEEEDGTIRFYGTYTAYNGREIVPQVSGSFTTRLCRGAYDVGQIRQK